MFLNNNVPIKELQLQNNTSDSNWNNAAYFSPPPYSVFHPARFLGKIGVVSSTNNVSSFSVSNTGSHCFDETRAILHRSCLIADSKSAHNQPRVRLTGRAGHDWRTRGVRRSGAITRRELVSRRT